MIGERDNAEDVGGEALLSVRLLAGLLPEGRGELEDAARGPGREQAQEVAQVGPGLDARLRARRGVLLRRLGAEQHVETGNKKQGRVIGSRNRLKLASLNDTWRTIRKVVGIPDFRIHDFRHSFASDALMGGVPLAIVGEMLGHRQPNTTKRYAHLANRVVREALEHTAGRIVEATNAIQALSAAPFETKGPAGWPPQRGHRSIYRIEARKS